MSQDAALPLPPAELRHLSRHLAPDALLRLIEAHGGTRFYVPRSVRSCSPIARSIGLEAAAALAAEFGGAHLKVPLARFWRIRILHARGLSHSRIARALGVTEGTVRNHLGRARRADAQPDLFLPD